MPDTEKMRWYVLHTYSGYEKKVQRSVDQTIENLGMHDLIKEVIIPMEKVIEIKNGVEQVKEKKVFPGYVLIKMIVTDDTWYLVRNTKGVTGFVGTNNKPIPLTDDEVGKWGLGEEDKEKQQEEIIAIDAEIGDDVVITSGPFVDRPATITSINNEKRMVKAKILMFGKETDIELNFSQIKKIEY